MRWSGDLRLREQADFFPSDNATNSYLDFQRVNDAGGIGKAGASALANTSEDRQRLRARLRFGFDVNLGDGWTMGTRLATGSLKDPVSTNQTLATYGFRDQFSVDLAWLDWQYASERGTQRLGFTGGRMRNPFFTASELVYDQDLAFDGIALSYRYAMYTSDLVERTLFATAGAFPLQEVELSNHDKWLFGGQVGLDWKHVYGSRTKFGAGLMVQKHFREDEFIAEQSARLHRSAVPQPRQYGVRHPQRQRQFDQSVCAAADYSLFNLSLSP